METSNPHVNSHDCVLVDCEGVTVRDCRLIVVTGMRNCTIAGRERVAITPMGETPIPPGQFIRFKHAALETVHGKLTTEDRLGDSEVEDSDCEDSLVATPAPATAPAFHPEPAITNQREPDTDTDIKQQIEISMAVRGYLKAREKFEQASAEFTQACQRVRAIKRSMRFVTRIDYKAHLVTIDESGDFEIESIEMFH